MSVPFDDDRLGRLSPQRRQLLEQLRRQREQAGAASAGWPAAATTSQSADSQAADSQTAPGPVLLRDGAQPRRLVLLHPSGGELFCYVPLIRALWPGPRVIGFTAVPADRAVPVEERVAAVAARVLDALLREEKLDGAVLAGWSFGGSVAYEVASQAERRGAGAPPVVLIDPPFAADPAAPVPDEAVLRRRFAYDLARIDGASEERLAELAGLDRAGSPPRTATDAAEPAPPDLAALLAQCGVRAQFPPAELEDRFRTFAAAATALLRYQPPAGYGGPVELVTAGPEPHISARWRAAAAGPFEHTVLGGDHYTVFHPDNMPALLRATHRALDH